MKRELTDVMKEMGVSAGEAIARLLEQPNQLSAIIRFGLEDDLRKKMQFPDTSIACDCGATTSTATHPRNYGTYPRVLGRYVRDDKVLTWQDAVRKMTALPAATVGMVDRGLLAAGMKADITVFDPATVIDQATYENPAVLSEGVRHVFVNGAHALRDGAVTGEQGGRLLRRAPGLFPEPSRPTTTGVRRSLSVRAQDDYLRVAIDVTQSPGERRARGTVRITDRKTGKPWPAAGDLGVLQVAERWASVTTSALRLRCRRRRPRGQRAREHDHQPGREALPDGRHPAQPADRRSGSCPEREVTVALPPTRFALRRTSRAGAIGVRRFSGAGRESNSDPEILVTF